MCTDEKSLFADLVSDAGTVPKSVLSAVFGSGGSWLPDERPDISAGDFFPSLAVGLSDFDFLPKVT